MFGGFPNLFLRVIPRDLLKSPLLLVQLVTKAITLNQAIWLYYQWYFWKCLTNLVNFINLQNDTISSGLLSLFLPDLMKYFWNVLPSIFCISKDFLQLEFILTCIEPKKLFQTEPIRTMWKFFFRTIKMFST